MALGIMREGFARLREGGETSQGEGAARREQAGALPAAGRCQGKRRGQGYEWNREASSAHQEPQGSQSTRHCQELSEMEATARTASRILDL